MPKIRPSNILVTGAHRSGTTWVGRTIAFHDSIRYMSEPFNVTYPKPEMNLFLKNWFTHAPTSEDLDKITSAFDNLLNPNIFHVVNQILSSSKSGYQAKKILIKRMLSFYLKKPRWLIKDPIAIFSAGWLYRRYNLKVVCLIRNPLGFVGSLKKANWNYFFSDLLEQDIFLRTHLRQYYSDIKKLSDNPSDIIDHGCLLWNIIHDRIRKYQSQYPSWLSVKHEDFASDPKNL
jgi:hypothetical protein